MTQSKQYVIFIGNPGVGKSTLLNGFVGKKKFESGISFGGGLTQALQFCEHGGIYYGDTPGLSDPDIRDKAAEEINKALTQDGIYRIFFLVTLEGARVRPDDATTIRLVVDSIQTEFEYGVIINKASPRVIKGIQNPQNRDRIISCLMANNCRPTQKVMFIPKVEAIDDEDNCVPEITKDLEEFIFHAVQPTIIRSDQVQEIEKSAFEEMREMMKRQIELVEENLRLLKEEMQRIKEQHRKEMEELRKKNDAVANRSDWEIMRKAAGRQLRKWTSWLF